MKAHINMEDILMNENILAILSALNNNNRYRSTIPLTNILNELLQNQLLNQYTSYSPKKDDYEDLIQYMNTEKPTNQITGLEQLKELAEQAWPDNQMMQQLAMSQAIQESGLPGNMSGLATKAHNLFGIKGPGTREITTEYYGNNPLAELASFTKNDSPLASFMEHKNLLTESPRYSSVLSAKSLPDAFQALQKGGYATDPNYAKNLNRIFNTYVKNLY